MLPTDDTTIWVNVGNAASLVGATVGATFVAALAIAKGLENDLEDDLLDADFKAQQAGEAAVGGSQQRTRLRAEDVIADQQALEGQAATPTPAQKPPA